MSYSFLQTLETIETQAHGMYGHTLARVKINRVWLPTLLVVSWTGKMNISLSPFAPENLVSRDEFDNPFSRQPAHLHTQAESGAYLRDSSRVPRRRPYIYSNRHTPSGQSRFHQVTQLRYDGVRRRESAGTEPEKPQGSSKRVLPRQDTTDQ